MDLQDLEDRKELQDLLDIEEEQVLLDLQDLQGLEDLHLQDHKELEDRKGLLGQVAAAECLMDLSNLQWVE